MADVSKSILGEEDHEKFSLSEKELECSVTANGTGVNLIPEALAEVFSRLPFEDRLRTVPSVCKDWRSATLDPTCWRNVDMDGWLARKMEEDYWWEFDCEPKIEILINTVVDRSCGQLRELRTKYCSDAAIDYIADRCPELMVLAIPNSLGVTDKSLINLASKCPKLQALDVSDCYNISNQALEAVGRNCASLVWLGRNMLQKKQGPTPRNGVSTGLVADPGGDEGGHSGVQAYGEPQTPRDEIRRPFKSRISALSERLWAVGELESRLLHSIISSGS